MSKVGQYMCFIGSKPNKKFDTTNLRQ
jgi:hypothetical protein